MKRSRKNRLARQKLRLEVEGVPPNAHTSVMMNPTMGMLKTISENIQSPTDTGFSTSWLEFMRERIKLGYAKKPIAKYAGRESHALDTGWKPVSLKKFLIPNFVAMSGLSRSPLRSINSLENP